MHLRYFKRNEMEDLFVDYNGKYPSVGTVHW